MNWYLGVLKKYAVFSGRARRKEYWMFTLDNLCIILFLIVLNAGIASAGHQSVLVGLYALAVFLPSVAVTVRRLHDTGRSERWFLVGLVPIIGWVVLLVFLAQDGQPGKNQYGANPKEAVATGAVELI